MDMELHEKVIKPKKKQTTRLRKYTCRCEKPVIIRAATNTLNAVCGICKCSFTMGGGEKYDNNKLL